MLFRYYGKLLKINQRQNQVSCSIETGAISLCLTRFHNYALLSNEKHFIIRRVLAKRGLAVHFLTYTRQYVEMASFLVKCTSSMLLNKAKC